MKQRHEKHGEDGHKALWGFLITGMVLLVAGTYLLLSLGPASLPKAAILTGACLMVSAIISMAITD